LTASGFAPLERRTDPERAGVRVAAGPEGLEVELHIVTAWGASIPAVAAEVEEAVRTYLESMVALEVGIVSVHVDDVAAP
ncbi:MAG: Asp23/Gls24 family envelope stress response protein, partial [Gaiellales bacterium]